MKKILGITALNELTKLIRNEINNITPISIGASPSNHNHDTLYAKKSHTHNATDITQDASHRFMTDTEKNTWNGKANGSHTHDDRYYTESEMNTKLAAKSNTDHTHNYIPTNKITNSSSITNSGVNVLDAIEKNPSVAGTLANQIAQQNSKLTNYEADKAILNKTGIFSRTGIPWSQINTVLNDWNEYQIILFTNWEDASCFPENYGSGIIFPCYDTTNRRILYIGRSGRLYSGQFISSNKNNITWYGI